MTENRRSVSEESVTSSNAALQKLYRITTEHQRPFEEKLQDLLEVGRNYLDVEAGFLTEISNGRQQIVKASGDNELLQSGNSCPLSKAYCRKTIDVSGALTVQHAEVEGWEGDAAYEEFGLESYIGAKVVIDGEIFGTFCFAGSTPRDRPFSTDEEVFVELMAEWVSYELFQQMAKEKIEKQRDKLEEFTGVVSHDLRNPLSVISGYLDLAEETGDAEYFDRCRNALERMEILIEDLLVLSRGGEATSEESTFDISETVSDCWDFVNSKNATLSLNINGTITADKSRIQQLFENLFRNAIEHGGEGVHITVGELEDNKGIFVEDDGVGIPNEDLDDIFTDGYSTTTNGTGLGLTIVNQVVSSHGWDIQATESENGGARFEITGIEFSNNGY